jgi:hypothetical protein
MCARNVYGHHINPKITINNLDLTWFEHNITSEQITNLDKVFFCGSYGDPCANIDLLDICRHFRTINPTITLGINTNGSIRNPEWWQECATIFDQHHDYVVFSIDGLKDTNHIYRKGVQWDKIMDNATSFITAGGSAHWDTIIFNHNKHQVEDMKSLSRKMGFTWFRIKETDRWDTYKPDKVNVTPISTYNTVDYSNAVPKCEILEDKSIYLDANGKFWPCCHMHEAYYNYVGYELHDDLRIYNNNELFDAYKPKLNTNPFYICKRACGNRGKKSQWKQEIQLQ